MDKTLLIIGEKIQSDEHYRVKYHPMIVTKGKPKDTKKVSIVDFTVDIDNNKIYSNEHDSEITEFKYINFKFSNADNASFHFMGNYFISGKKTDTNIVKTIVDKHFTRSILTENIKTKNAYKKEIIKQYWDTIYNNIDSITEILNQSITDTKKTEVYIFISVYKDGILFEPHANPDILDIIDELFLEQCLVDKKFLKANKLSEDLLDSDSNQPMYTFKSAFYSMFSFNKYAYSNAHNLMLFDKKDFLSLYYAKKVNEFRIRIGETHSMSIIPSHSSMDLSDIDLFNGIHDGFNLNDICEKIQNVIDNKVDIDDKERKILPLIYSVDVTYRYSNGQAGDYNLTKISGIRYSELQLLRDKLINAGFSFKTSLYAELSKYYQTPHDYFKNINGYSSDNDKYNSTIIDTLISIYSNRDFIANSDTDRCILETAQYAIRNDMMNIHQFWWNNIFETYKILNSMDELNFNTNLNNDLSFKLGAELSAYESIWRDDRNNLKKVSKNFWGNYNDKVYDITDIESYFTNIQSRLIRNESYEYRENGKNVIDFINLIRQQDNFNSDRLFLGYCSERFKYTEKKEKDNSKKNE